MTFYFFPQTLNYFAEDGRELGPTLSIAAWFGVFRALQGSRCGIEPARKSHVSSKEIIRCVT